MSWMNSSEIRKKFASLMSAMYQKEVPLYAELISLVHEINHASINQQAQLKQHLENTQQLSRLDDERHGAIRLGKAQELHLMQRVFKVMGMSAVGYYDLVPAGVPVHATAFRAIEPKELNQSPFRVFTSLLRLELIQDVELRQIAQQILDQRQIFSPKAIVLLEKYELQQGLDAVDADAFIVELLETFRWHSDAAVSKDVYQALLDQHRLVADVVAFKGPHINHLTPRSLDIDQSQEEMKQRGFKMKAVIEGPPLRNCPILLRQTSFKALSEKVNFKGEAQLEQGVHSARFGEIEQRGMALTPKGRLLYDQLLSNARRRLSCTPDDDNALEYQALLEQEFLNFPDNYLDLYLQNLAYFYFIPMQTVNYEVDSNQLNALIQLGIIGIEPMIYEDFLPVSAAGIFQSNLGDCSQRTYLDHSNQQLFEQSLGCEVLDEMQLYAQAQHNSLEHCLQQLNLRRMI